MLIRALILILLAGCAPSDRQIRQLNSGTQVWHSVSRDAEVFRDRKDHVLARTIIMEKQGVTRYVLSLSVLRGGSNRPQILHVMNGDVPLPYVRHDRLSAHCIDHCHKTEVGSITLDKSTFRNAANDGLRLRIIGHRRDYTTSIPANIFWHALETAGRLGPTRAR